jgi:hypothetical protein
LRLLQYLSISAGASLPLFVIFLLGICAICAAIASVIERKRDYIYKAMDRFRPRLARPRRLT